ncbi:N-acetyltransferase family protein [Mycolicibacterium sp. XJ870]
MTQIRPAVGADALAVADVHVRAWQVGYRGILPQDYLDGLTAADRASRYTFDAMPLDGPYTLVATDHGAIRGLVTIGRCRDSGLSGLGEVWALYTDPNGWGRGIGRELIAAARELLYHNGFTEGLLWVLEQNDRARRFYERDGWCPDGTRRTDLVADVPVEDIRYRRLLP